MKQLNWRIIMFGSFWVWFQDLTPRSQYGQNPFDKDANTIESVLPKKILLSPNVELNSICMWTLGIILKNVYTLPESPT